MYTLLHSASLFMFTTVCCLMPCLLLYYVGYEIRIDWNNNAAETTCTITGHRIIALVCTESCNCITTCANSQCSSSITTCQTCEYDCYDGYVQVSYIVDESYQNEQEMYSSKRSRTNLQSELKFKYPIDSRPLCYYQEDDPSDFKLELHAATVYLAFSIIFGILGGILIIGWTGFVIYKEDIGEKILNKINCKKNDKTKNGKMENPV